MNMKGDGYNGWKNYQTWLVGLWLDNDRESYEYWREQARSIWNDATGATGRPECKRTQLETAARFLSVKLCDELDRLEAASGVGLHADLLRSALDEVDWYEVAEHYLSDIEE